MDEEARKKTFVIFDIDGTLCDNGKHVGEEMRRILAELRKKVTVGLICGSQFSRVADNLGQDVLDHYDYVFTENGLVAFKGRTKIGTQDIRKHYDSKTLTTIVNWVLRYIADLDTPVKRGTFVDFRTGLINISPPGRQINLEERAVWVEHDEKHGIRKKMVADMKERFKDLDLDYVIGGQQGFDIFPKGWDKSYCLTYVKDQNFQDTHFFGDRMFVGGNDWELGQKVKHPHPIDGPEDTKKIILETWIPHFNSSAATSTASK